MLSINTEIKLQECLRNKCNHYQSNFALMDINGIYNTIMNEHKKFNLPLSIYLDRLFKQIQNGHNDLIQREKILKKITDTVSKKNISDSQFTNVKLLFIVYLMDYELYDSYEGKFDKEAIYQFVIIEHDWLNKHILSLVSTMMIIKDTLSEVVKMS
ncbi:hypothetical protein [Acanthamoeba castellanii mimivirus]|uniref:Uncharacterized protein R790 n=5 Tax=Mimivirus TaxID=315393 RepID=YR790_MIMIV|nr:hypothetical protein MIMI_gp0852 [Acanthamoeba polyphaga mimivirus]Q5UQ05.1 RecName: Full=Uncharacterized protein R790 [Acanthamoeba polyphaga mimivirus]AEQ61005.1 hypothetical protein [Acanthamoeba castellanii mamavirus]AHJ40380.1 hypothetical protein [Samba virus]ALR84411.1 hypothetical protein [Niemeyer virus]AMZ03232.1 hypothetical protein [Mimivirus Bombay]EJN40550.1 hypothetical protein lvs_R692 [Acanthamoeba polyphaga lentillevirus]BAV61928.1 hypothetical protein [Acanthamoeba cast